MAFGGEKTAFKILSIIDPRQSWQRLSNHGPWILWLLLPPAVIITNSYKKEFTHLFWPAKLGLGKTNSSPHLALILSMGIVSFIFISVTQQGT